jgi:hypothetical protein
MLPEDLDRLLASSGLRDHLQARHRIEQSRQPLADDVVIVDNHQSDGHCG